MKRTKLVSVSRGEKSIQDRIKDALKQYSIKEESLIEVRIGEEEKRFEKDAVALVRLRCDF